MSNLVSKILQLQLEGCLFIVLEKLTKNFRGLLFGAPGINTDVLVLKDISIFAQNH